MRAPPCSDSGLLACVRRAPCHRRGRSTLVLDVCVCRGCAAFAINCNMGMVEMERVESEAEADTLRSYLQAHTDKTGSTVAAGLLSSWPAPLGQFVKVMPTDYKRVLEQQAADADADAAIG